MREGGREEKIGEEAERVSYRRNPTLEHLLQAKPRRWGRGRIEPQINKRHLEGTCTCFLSGALGGPQASRKGYIVIEVLELGWPREVQVVVDWTVPGNSSPCRRATGRSGKGAGPG